MQFWESLFSLPLHFWIQLRVIVMTSEMQFSSEKNLQLGFTDVTEISACEDCFTDVTGGIFSLGNLLFEKMCLKERTQQITG